MTNLLSDEDNSNGNRPAREVDSESPLPIEGNFDRRDQIIIKNID